jgi:DNA sulfur modification protein DndC
MTVMQFLSTDILSDILEKDNYHFSNLLDSASTLEESLEQSIGKLQQAFIAGKTKWVVTYSGGKDSTLLAVLAGEIVRRRLWWSPKAVHVVYSDTLQEIPQMHNVAMKFIAHIQELNRSGVPITAHVVHPDWSQTFWVLVLGKGYPVPHRRFWWCTERLKVNPVKKVLKELGREDDVAILTGVRFGESDRRDGKMKRAASYCVGQGECGQSLEYHGALAPIAHWKTCHVWDFLALCAPAWGWPTMDVVNLYGDAPVRFGCWTCTLVERDRALETVMAKDGNGYLRELARFRQRLVDISNDPSMRVLRPDGRPGKLKTGVRRMLLSELLELQAKIGIQLICPEEVQAIQELWENDPKGDSYS